LAPDEKIPRHSILRSKRDATRFQILVEIAEHQPAIRQQEIAGKLGITPQAVSEYIRDLEKEGLVSAHGRSRYEVTRTGIEWVIENAETIEKYARHIRRDVIQQVSVWAAVAAEDLNEGDEVGVYMKNGWLYAGKRPQNAMGIVAMDAQAGQDVGVARLSGLISHTEGTIHVCKVPRIQYGGSRKVNQDSLLRICEKAGVIAAVGIEAYTALAKAGRKPDMFFGAREGVIEAAYHGIECVIILVDEEFTDFLKRLEGTTLKYIIHDLAGES